MKLRTTVIFGAATLILGLGVYYFDVKMAQKQEQLRIGESQLIPFPADQINLIEIQKKDEKIVLQKNEKGWFLLEPIQDQADSAQLDELLKSFVEEKVIATAKDSSQLSPADLKEYGLDEPAVVYTFKNNSGSSKKISVGNQRNFEGNSFVRADSENKVFVAGTPWLARSETKLIYYREKKLYRKPLVEVKNIQVKSLQDQFELQKVKDNWEVVGTPQEVDQSKVRELLRKVSETIIQEYVFEGEPSASIVKENGLRDTPVQVKLSSADSDWSVAMNLNGKDRSLYALTERPTSLLKLDVNDWEFYGNLSLDSLRDRSTITRFNLNEVSKVYYKSEGKEATFVKTDGQWKPLAAIAETQVFSEKEINSMLNRLHDLEISEFVEKGGAEFKGSNMIILKTDSDRLVYQLNWGPELKLKRKGEEKAYYYARTQVAPLIFAVDKAKLDSLNFLQAVRAKDAGPVETAKE